MNLGKSARRLGAALLLTVGSATAVVAAPTSVSADTTCNDIKVPVAGSYNWERYCKSVHDVSGASISTSVWWWYKGGKTESMVGGAAGKVYDTADDGTCAYVRLVWAASDGVPPGTPPQTIGQACGKGATGGIDVDRFNDGVQRYTYGVYKLWLCAPIDTCTRVWKQQVDANPPS